MIYHSKQQPMPALEWDTWVDFNGNIRSYMSGTWVLVNSAYREEAPAENIIPRSIPVDYTPDTEDNTREKLAVFEKVLANPEPPETWVPKEAFTSIKGLMTEESWIPGAKALTGIILKDGPKTASSCLKKRKSLSSK